MNSLLESLPQKQQKRLSQKAFPAKMEPMLAKLTDDYFDDKNWIYERKLDGVRTLVFYNGNELHLKSRNQNKINNSYPELIEALTGGLEEPFVADGEIVTFEGDTTSFSRLQNRIHLEDPQEARNSGVKVFLYLFDLIYFSGYDLSDLNLRSRKKLLKKALKFNDPIRFTSHRNEAGKAYLDEACSKGWEGVIAKDGEASYVHSRSNKWLKFKCSHRQELVVGGFTDPHGERLGFGALLLGYYENGDLKYAGQVGTGFDDQQLKDLHTALTSLERKTSPYAQNDISKNDVHWVTPKLVAEIGFTEWTDKNKLRHPRFLGLRSDKEPANVHKEKP